jgi:hypothetical protein
VKAKEKEIDNTKDKVLQSKRELDSIAKRG